MNAKMKHKKDLLADDDGDTVKFTINEKYAESYNIWRQKERLQTLKDRYGEVSDAESSSSEEEDENARELTKDVEKNFFRTLSCLKQKDPRIYDANVKFFDDRAKESEPIAPAKKKAEKPFLLKDHQRRIVLEKSGKFVDDDGEEVHVVDLTPVQEQNAIKESFKEFLANSDDEGHEGWGSLFQKREKTKEELKKEEDDYREWLKGQKEELPDKALQTDMKYLHDYWNDPNLNTDEAFLKDYLLNRRFLDSDDEDYTPRFPDIDVEDEDKLEEQEEFERKYNFRFENEDPEFIKRYPRTVENSMRKKDTRRTKARQEIKERKQREKLEKIEELKQLKALKRKELLEKIEQLKAVTGNAELAFKDDDLDGDFDPEVHDKKMQELFNDDYYEEGGDEEKPMFPDEELDIENWKDWNGEDDENFSQNSGPGQEETYNEDAEFNMDCDYDPQAVQSELIQMTKSKKKRKRQSKLAQVLAKAKPVFDPNDSTFDNFLDEYYKLDFEDIVDGMPTRFKYRQTTPNNYGLTVDEILRADEKELNQWCSLKKVVKLKPENVERFDVHAYAKKAENEALKRKILPSLYRRVNEDSEETEDIITSTLSTDYGNETGEQVGQKRKKTRDKSREVDSMEVTPLKKPKIEESRDFDNGVGSSKLPSENKDGEIWKAKNNGGNKLYNNDMQGEGHGKEKKKIKKKAAKNYEGKQNSGIQTIGNGGEKRKKKKAKNDKGKQNSVMQTAGNGGERKKKKKRKAKSYEGNHLGVSETRTEENGCQKEEVKTNHVKSTQYVHSGEKKAKLFRKQEHTPDVPISDVRLKAYGLNPKKFRNKIKYSNRNRQ